MKINITPHQDYQVVRIEDELEIITDLSELKFLIDGYISVGKHKIAVAFSNTSYIYSGAIAVLMSCHNTLSEYDEGELCIVEPNKEIQWIFSKLNIDKVLNIYDSIDELPIKTSEDS